MGRIGLLLVDFEELLRFVECFVVWICCDLAMNLDNAELGLFGGLVDLGLMGLMGLEGLESTGTVDEVDLFVCLNFCFGGSFGRSRLDEIGVDGID